jgi:chemotaxis signal transduction protein
MSDPPEPFVDPDLWTDDVLTPETPEAKVPAAPPPPPAPPAIPRAAAARPPAPRPPATGPRIAPGAAPAPAALTAPHAPAAPPAKPNVAPAAAVVRKVLRPIASAAVNPGPAAIANTPAIASPGAIANPAAIASPATHPGPAAIANPAINANTPAIANPAPHAAPGPAPRAEPAAAPPAPVLAPPSNVQLRESAGETEELQDLFGDWTPPKPLAPPTPPERHAAISLETAVSSMDRAASTQARPGATADRLTTSLCAFWLGAECFALDVALVGEVVTVDDVVPVALAPEPVLGLFNLRGTPVALVDLAAVLEISPGVRPEQGADKRRSALVLRPDDVLAAVLIDRMEIVLTKGRDARASGPSADDKPFVKGFVEVHDRGGLVVTVLDPAAIVQRLDQLKFT